MLKEMRGIDASASCLLNITELVSAVASKHHFTSVSGLFALWHIYQDAISLLFFIQVKILFILIKRVIISMNV